MSHKENRSILLSCKKKFILKFIISIILNILLLVIPIYYSHVIDAISISDFQKATFYITVFCVFLLFIVLLNIIIKKHTFIYFYRYIKNI